MRNYISSCQPVFKESFYILTSNTWEFQLLYIFVSTWYIVSNFNFSYSGERVLTSHCHLYLHFSKDKWRQASYVLIGYLCIFFCEVSIQMYFKKWFIFLVLIWKSSLYIPDTSSLSEHCFMNIFSQLVAKLLLLNNVFKERKFKFWSSSMKTFFFLHLLHFVSFIRNFCLIQGK